ncbi:hypothetical protein BDZ89DRAFT_966028 [Hymenopellis radicata]|nr:hypothetical protein BDZ89DRAFT_966028 [Hymenopellis radicata]
MSPYRAVTGQEPLLPLDFIQATWLTTPPSRLLTHDELIVQRALELLSRQEELDKLSSDVYASRVAAAQRWADLNAQRIRDFNFKRGSLVLMENTRARKTLPDKAKARYFGPLVVLFRNRGGAYHLCELNGAALNYPVSACRVMPYLARAAVPLPPGFLADLAQERVDELEASEDGGVE